jgi:protein transport protein SEC31
MHRYMKLCPKPYMNIIKATVDGDYEGIVRTRPVGQWRETLALLATYSSTVSVMKDQSVACL